MGIRVIDAFVAGGSEGQAVARRNGEGTGLVSHGVVALGRVAGDIDVVSSNSLTVNSLHGVVDLIVVQIAGHSSGQSGIHLAEGLAVVHSSYRHCLRVNRQSAVNVSDMIVILEFGASGGDGVGADILTFLSANGEVDVFFGRVGNSNVEVGVGVGVAVGLGRAFGRNGDILIVVDCYSDSLCSHSAAYSGLIRSEAGNHGGGLAVNRVFFQVHCIIRRSRGIVLFVHIVDGQLIGNLLPHGVENVGGFAGVIHHNLVVGLVLDRTGFASGPALELVAVRISEARPHGHCLIIQAGNLIISRSFLDGIRRIIRMVGQGRGRGRIAPDGGEGYVAGDLDFIAGLIDLFIVGPAQEHLSGRSRQGRSAVQHAGDGATVIRLGIGYSAGAAVGIVGHGVLLGADEVRIQHHISCDGGVDIKGNERRSVVFHPAAVPFAAHGHFYIFQVIRVDLLAVWYRDCFRFAAQNDVKMDLSCLLRSGPLGVNNTVTDGHGGQLRRSLGAVLTGGRGVPALELVVGIHSGRYFGGVTVVTGQGCLILDGLGSSINDTVHIVELEIVAFAGVV